MKRNLRNLVACLIALILMAWPILANAAQTRWTASRAYKYCLANKLDDQATAAVFLAWFGPARDKRIATLHFPGQITYTIVVVDVDGQYMAFNPSADDLAYGKDPGKTARALYPKSIAVDLISYSKVRARLPWIEQFHDE